MLALSVGTDEILSDDGAVISTLNGASGSSTRSSGSRTLSTVESSATGASINDEVLSDTVSADKIESELSEEVIADTRMYDEKWILRLQRSRNYFSYNSAYANLNKFDASVSACCMPILERSWVH